MAVTYLFAIFLYSVTAVEALKFSMAQKKFQKMPVGGSASWGKCQSGEVLVEGVPVGESASWGKCQLGEVPAGGQVPVGGQKFNPLTDNFFQFCKLLKINSFALPQTATSPNWPSPRAEIPFFAKIQYVEKVQILTLKRFR